MTEVNKTKLRKKILRSKELTALEKRYLEGQVNASDWIPCKDKMPKDGQRVLICTGTRKVFVAAYNQSAQLFLQRIYQNVHSWLDCEVTHWMPLPALPEVNYNVE